MGTVYLAEQPAPIHRRVAVKLMQQGKMDRQAAYRFEAERQALAPMSHPHAANALDQPLTDGTLFTGDRVVGTPA